MTLLQISAVFHPALPTPTQPPPSILFSIVAAEHKGSLSSTPLPTCVISCVLGDTHLPGFLTDVTWHLTVVLIGIALVVSEVEHLFMFPLSTGMSSLGKNVSSDPLPSHFHITKFYLILLHFIPNNAIWYFFLIIPQLYDFRSLFQAVPGISEKEKAGKWIYGCVFLPIYSLIFT